MGHTPKPLTLCLHPAVYKLDPGHWEGLKAQGHDIFVDDLLERGYHYLGPNCWRTLDLEYLDVTIAAIRKEVYEVRTPKPGSDDPKRSARARKSRARKPARPSTTLVEPSGTIGE